MALDKRINPYRSDLAAVHLKGKVEAAHFVDGEPASVVAGRASLRVAPSHSAAQDSELLFGESVTVYERKDGWAWVQARGDHYVGYVREEALGAPVTADARVTALSTPLLSAPGVKAPLRDCLPLGAVLRKGAAAGDYFQIAPDAFVYYRHLASLDEHAADFVAVAERFLGAPYVWGGRTVAGLDCSGLIQTVLAAAGINAPRDTDMMEKALGVALGDEPKQRGDLIFWKGHMGVMLDETHLLHANAFHMEVFTEPLAEAVARIAKSAGPVTSVRRL